MHYHIGILMAQMLYLFLGLFEQSAGVPARSKKRTLRTTLRTNVRSVHVLRERVSLEELTELRARRDLHMPVAAHHSRLGIIAVPHCWDDESLSIRTDRCSQARTRALKCTR